MTPDNTWGSVYWSDVIKEPAPHYPALQNDTTADVVIIGAGIVGLTTALRLIEAGKSVVVLEATRVGTQVTARSTAKITSQHGLLYRQLIEDFGESAAKLYATANQAAIAEIGQIVEHHGIDCSFQYTPSYIYASTAHNMEALQSEAQAAARLGLPARLTTDVPAPVNAGQGLRFDDQAQFNPAQYLHGLARAVSGQATLHEQSRVVKVDSTDGRYRVHTSAGPSVQARHVVVATHMPVVPEGKFFAKAFTFAHTALAAPLTSGVRVDGMFMNAGSPSYSFRTDTTNEETHLIAVGPTYKTGVQDEEMQSFADLEAFVRQHFGVQSITHRWTNEDFQSMDGLPFIGCAESSNPHLYVAVGFNAWGITNGTVAAQLLSDLILGRPNPYSRLFDATRINALEGALDFLKGNLESAKHMVADRFSTRKEEELTKLQPGQAAVVRHNGKEVASYCDDSGTLHTVSAVCTHMGCLVGWNPVDRTWDCPCHGSRFRHDGEVVHGPATKPLKPL